MDDILREMVEAVLSSPDYLDADSEVRGEVKIEALRRALILNGKYGPADLAWWMAGEPEGQDPDWYLREYEPDAPAQIGARTYLQESDLLHYQAIIDVDCMLFTTSVVSRFLRGELPDEQQGRMDACCPPPPPEFMPLCRAIASMKSGA